MVEEMNLRFLCMELKPKISVFMLLCVQTSGVRAFKCFGIKIVVPPCVHVFKPEKSELSHFLASKFLCVGAFMRSNLEIWLSHARIGTKISVFMHLCV